MWEQNETGSEGEFPKDVGPAVLGWFWGSGNDPKLASGMVDEGNGVTLGGSNGPAAAEEVDLMIGIESAREVEGEVQVEEAGIPTSSSCQGVLGPQEPRWSWYRPAHSP